MRSKLFSDLGQIFGNTLKIVDRMFNTFESREVSTGILLSGEKGSGKTLTAQLLCRKAIEQGYPVIIINNGYSGDKFNTFIQSIGQKTVILFDEFEKTYSSSSDISSDDDVENCNQEKLLTLLDGTFSSKKLFIFTCNNKFKIDIHMLNRPGRIYYNIEYKSIAEDVIQEYCAVKLKYPEYYEQIVTLSKVFAMFSFDMLKAIVEECNRYKESPFEFIDMLNIKISNERYIDPVYDVEFTCDGKPVTDCYSHIPNSPMSLDSIKLLFDKNGKITFNRSHITKFTKDNITYANGKYKLEYKAKINELIDYKKFMEY